jgi:hypothetical protein
MIDCWYRFNRIGFFDELKNELKGERTTLSVNSYRDDQMVSFPAKVDSNGVCRFCTLHAFKQMDSLG